MVRLPRSFGADVLRTGFDASSTESIDHTSLVHRSLERDPSITRAWSIGHSSAIHRSPEPNPSVSARRPRCPYLGSVTNPVRTRRTDPWIVDSRGCEHSRVGVGDERPAVLTFPHCPDEILMRNSIRDTGNSLESDSQKPDTPGSV